MRFIMSNNKYFTKDEITETFAEAKDYIANNFEDLFNAMVNADYDYIGDRCEANRAISNFKNDEELDNYKTNLDGALGALEVVRNYKRYHRVTPIDDPVKIANGIEFVRSSNLFYKVLNKANLTFYTTTTEENLDKFIKVAKSL